MKEKTALFIRSLIKMFELEIKNTAEQRDLLTARNDVERVELNAFHLLNGGSGASQPFEPSAGPKPLLAEQESAECDAGNCIHKKITEDISPRSPFVVESIYLVIAQ